MYIKVKNASHFGRWHSNANFFLKVFWEVFELALNAKSKKVMPRYTSFHVWDTLPIHLLKMNFQVVYRGVPWSKLFCLRTLLWKLIQLWNSDYKELLKKPYVNEVTLTGLNLSLKCYYSLRQRLCQQKRFRSFKRNTVDFCRSKCSRCQPSKLEVWKKFCRSAQHRRVVF